MAGSVNKVILVGNLGKDPEVRTTQSGGKIANLSVATSESWNDKQSGERKEKTEWHRVTVFNDKLVEIIEKYCHKGDKIYVEGQLQTRKYTDNSGVEKYTTEVVLSGFHGTITMLNSAKGGDQQGEQGGGGRNGYQSGPTPAQRSAASQGGGQQGGGMGGGELDDVIPFAACWQ
jgi:single-strand DNA-binding protein